MNQTNDMQMETGKELARLEAQPLGVEVESTIKTQLEKSGKGPL